MVEQDTTEGLPLSEEEDLSYLGPAPLAAGMLVRGTVLARGCWRFKEGARRVRHDN